MEFSISDSIKRARETFAHLKDDGLTTSIGDIWSIKKMLLLDYYMPSFIQIVSKNNFNKFYFADPFCGSGIFTDFKDKELKNEIFPGSSLIGALNASELGYTNCIFSESNSSNIEALNSRLAKCKTRLHGKEYTSQKLEFEKAVEKILKMRQYQVAILVLIDPDGYVPIKWKLMEKLIKEVGIDIIFNFYTQGIAHNVSTSKKKSEHEENLNDFFGDDGWKEIRDNRLNANNLGPKLLKYYLDKIQSNSTKFAVDVGVYKQGDSKLYDLILITRSKGGANVMNKAKEVMNNATTEVIKREFKAQLGSQSRLFE
jgi:three-Cys-motif partner protein